MFTVEEVSRDLSVSKVTIYNKLKKYESKVVLKQGKKYITEDLFNLIKEELKVKSEVKSEENEKCVNREIAMDRDVSFNLNNSLNADLIDILKEQLREKDIQLREKDKQIQELINLNKNNQVLLKQQQDKEINQLKLEGHIKEFDEKLLNLKKKMDNKKNTKKSFFSIFNRY
ncbi:hypothetical protein [Clostridium perfringens]|uniref:hypothetical protein n=1 Tax=Clostridium perfringens TaxID=1502 RepID=UPI000D70F4B7|nr:hypothetical protein [Clostridium perfringens]PWX45544.1 hypothetical protein CYK61_15230 [Clostridium perfringens]